MPIISLAAQIFLKVIIMIMLNGNVSIVAEKPLGIYNIILMIMNKILKFPILLFILVVLAINFTSCASFNTKHKINKNKISAEEIEQREAINYLFYILTLKN
jgi:hypothetical protein